MEDEEGDGEDLPVRLEIGDNLVHTTHITVVAVTLTHTNKDGKSWRL